MTVTDSDRQESGNAVKVEPSNGFHNARAREGQSTPSDDTLPDTESGETALADWWWNLRDRATSLWDGSFWDEQPPSPRELVERCRESKWANSDAKALVWTRWTGCVLSVIWSLPLYGLALCGQRIGRAVLAAFVIYLFRNLI
jgi:hypothetical protein